MSMSMAMSMYIAMDMDMDMDMDMGHVASQLQLQLQIHWTAVPPQSYTLLREWILQMLSSQHWRQHYIHLVLCRGTACVCLP